MPDKRTDILNATLTLISEYGFHGTPMSKVAQVAGVGAGTIYRYFDNKEELINELFVEVKAQFSRAMLSGFSRQAATEETFRRVMRNTFEYCLQNPQEMGALSILYAATSPDIKGGEYIGQDGFMGQRGFPHLALSSKESHNEATAQQLWQVSEELTGVKFNI